MIQKRKNVYKMTKQSRGATTNSVGLIITPYKKG